MTPHAYDAECSVIAAMIFDNKYIVDVLQVIDVEDFYAPEPQEVFKAIKALYLEGFKGEIECIIIRDWMKKNKRYGKGFEDFMIQVLGDAMPTADNVVHYAEIVKSKSNERKLLDRYKKLETAMNSGDYNLSDKNRLFEGFILDAVKEDEGQVVGAHEGAFDFIKALDEKPESLSSGFSSIDEKTGGFRKGEFMILAARPSMGKSALMTNIALSMAQRGEPIAIFSLEMSLHSLWERIYSATTGIELGILRNRYHTEEMYAQLLDVGGKLRELPLWIDDSGSLSSLTFLTRMLKLKAQHGIKCVFIDYLQLMIEPGYQGDRQKEISYISRFLKTAAKLLKLPIICLSQMSRMSEHRDNHRPKLSDLRESGAIEQDADMVMFLYRDDYYRKREDPTYEETGDASLIVAKNRQGPIGDINLIWVPELVTFKEREPIVLGKHKEIQQELPI